MRISVGIITSAAVLFAAGAFGLVGSWALVLGTLAGFVGAICVVTVLEEREYAAKQLPMARLRATLEQTALPQTRERW